MKYITILFIILWTLPVLAVENIAQHLQNISVTIKSVGKYGGGGTGSGVIVTREVQTSDENSDKQTVNFIWTASHVVKNLRTVRKVIGDKGQEQQIVEFRDAKLVKELVEKGRKVGQVEMDAKVIKYSDSENGEDLALLMVRKRNFVTASATFHLNDDVVPIGTQLFHVGSLLGQAGANSMTTGIMSQVGRVLSLGSGDGVIFDQTTATAFPGSSGGGVFFATGDNQGKYLGMLVRGAGEGFNLIVPIRRMHRWAKANGVEWALNAEIPTPTLAAILSMKNEDPGIKKHSSRASEANIKDNPFPFLLQYPIKIKQEIHLRPLLGVKPWIGKVEDYDFPIMTDWYGRGHSDYINVPHRLRFDLTTRDGLSNTK